jgi:FtsP/CotA-like multicopper oxidase with cupredoxin domain
MKKPSRIEISDPSRRHFLRAVSGASAGLLLAGPAAAIAAPTLAPEESAAESARRDAVLAAQPADVTLRIGTVLVDVTKDFTVSTIGYNGSAPAPLLRFREGVPVTVDLFNDTDTPEFVHWHGQHIPADVDGAPQEKSLAVPARGHLRYRLTPRPAGLRFVHSHVGAGSDLHRATYTGQFGIVYIEPAHDPGRYDREVFLATHEWEPFFSSGEEEDEDLTPAERAEQVRQDREAKKPNGWEIGYRLFSINGHALGHGEPVRVRQGERVLFHILNGSATEKIQLALPGHRFQVVALDGNAVPRPQPVDVLQLGTAERIDAIVEMNHPGVWILGTPKDDDRRDGMGIVVEYAGRTGAPQWIAPRKSHWDYSLFGDDGAVAAPDEIVPMIFGKINGGRGGFNLWTVNGEPYEKQGAPRVLKLGRRYRLAFENRTDDFHPLHLHRNTFELTSLQGKPTAGIHKDVVLIRPFGKVAVDFTANQPGLTLFHCHQQLHMDFGFMKLFDVV